MSRANPRNIAESVRQRLLNLARNKGQIFDLILNRYAIERLLYRISISEFKDRFLLKGATLYSLWYDQPLRATRDLDLLGYGLGEVDILLEIFRKILKMRSVDDGIRFDPDTLRSREIRLAGEYHGVRLNVAANLAQARIAFQVDIGFGDVVMPAPETVVYPTLLDFPAPELRAYSKYSVVAEKFESVVKLGLSNTRMKDFFDLWVMCRFMTFEGDILAAALAATFERRRTPLPVKAPLALTDSFGMEPMKQTQWAAFLQKNRLTVETANLSAVVADLNHFLMPAVTAVANGEPFEYRWPKSGPWVKSQEGRN